MDFYAVCVPSWDCNIYTYSKDDEDAAKLLQSLYETKVGDLAVDVFVTRYRRHATNIKTMFKLSKSDGVVRVKEGVSDGGK
jgi:hypothetical protein